MAIIRWEPAREISSLQQEVNRLFNSFFDAPVSGAGARRWTPAMDLVEQDDHYVLRADLPGVSQDDVELSLEDGVLTVAGERRAEHEERGEGFVRLERATGAFRRSLTLPEGVDGDAITATFDNGVLEVRIPKPQERQPKRVQITVGGRREAQQVVDGAATDAPAGTAA